MPQPLDDHVPVKPPCRRFQFSLLTLFLFSLLFGICCAGIFNPYNFVRVLTLLAVQAVLFYVYLTWWIYGRGYLRTFSIGATMSFVFPWAVTGIMWILLPFTFFNSNGISQFETLIGGTATLSDGIAFLWQSILAFILLFDSLFTGGTMVFTRWLIDRSRRKAAETFPNADQPLASATIDAATQTIEGVVS